MATEDTCPAPADLNAEATAERSFETRVGVRGRWREYAADRKRRMLAKWLRPTANRAQPAHYHARTSEPLLPHGVGAVRTGLLELATRLEHRPNPTPECVAARDDHQVGRRKQPPTAAGGSALSMIGSGGAVVVSQRRARRSQTARTS